jgi:CheY-like chemotaxis protein
VLPCLTSGVPGFAAIAEVATAIFADGEKDGHQRGVKLGEGLIGQCAEKRPVRWIPRKGSSPEMPMQILVVDDHDVVRAGVKMILRERPDWQVCGEAANGADAVKSVGKLQPDIVILDISLPDSNGLEVTREIVQLGGRSKIVILTMHDASSLAGEAKEAGARGLVLKSFAGRDLLRALEVVLDGGTFFGRAREEENPNRAREGGEGMSVA